MLGTLQSFIAHLRTVGLDISPAEMLDAARALDAVGPEDRTRFRVALGATLAKDAVSRRLFDEAFEAWFAPPARGAGGRRGAGEPTGAGGGGAGGSGAGVAGSPPPRPRSEEEPHPSGARGSGTGPTAVGSPGTELEFAL